MCFFTDVISCCSYCSAYTEAVADEYDKVAHQQENGETQESIQDIQESTLFIVSVEAYENANNPEESRERMLTFV